jgi:transcriptional regulator with XRE-family HTH domain
MLNTSSPNRLGLAVDFLSLIERGINALSFAVLEQMAERLDLRVRELFDFRKTARPLALRGSESKILLRVRL